MMGVSWIGNRGSLLIACLRELSFGMFWNTLSSWLVGCVGRCLGLELTGVSGDTWGHCTIGHL